MSDLPFRYRLKFEIEIKADGIQAYGDGTKATTERISDLLSADPNVVYVNRWPTLSYVGKKDD